MAGCRKAPAPSMVTVLNVRFAASGCRSERATCPLAAAPGSVWFDTRSIMSPLSAGKTASETRTGLKTQFGGTGDCRAGPFPRLAGDRRAGADYGDVFVSTNTYGVFSRESKGSWRM